MVVGSINYLNALEISEENLQALAELPNQAISFGILEGNHPYNLLILENQPAFALIKSNNAYTILAGLPNQEQLEIVFKELDKFKTVILLCKEELQPFFLKRGYLLQPRIELEYPDESKDYPEPSVPKEYSLKAIDTLALFEQCTWFDFVSSLFGSPEKFLQLGFGFALTNEDGKPIAESYSCFISKNFCEIGVITHPDYRGKGYAPLVVQKVIDECLRRNLKPIWSCNSDNVASLQVALKSGFKIKQHYNFVKKA